MRTFANVISLLVLFSVSLHSQYANLRVQHPQKLSNYKGTIEEARLFVTPKGIYTQNDLYLTFSARGTGFLPDDSVEVQFTFELPKGIIFDDLWLWIDDTTISKAYILDRWTASGIYESIVNRRRDPAILTKESYSSTYDSYKLLVYPMAANSTRKVKISYLAPGEWTNTLVSYYIPSSFFRVSLYKPPSIEVLYKQTPPWGFPRIMEDPALQFSVAHYQEFGIVYRCEIPSSYYTSSTQRLTLGIETPMKNGLYVARFQQGEDGFYHLAAIPGKILNTNVSKKVVFLVDYDSTKTTWQKQDILYNLRTHLETYYTASDSFNLVFTQSTIKVVGSTWYSAGLPGISQAFQAAGSSPIINKTDLGELVKKGVEFVKSHGGMGELCILGASDRMGDYYVANPIINEIRGMVTPGIRINVVDLLNRNYNNYYFGGTYYTGNDYFYGNLTKFTAGYWASARSSTMITMLDGFSKFVAGSIEAFDLYTRLSQGVCYARYTSGTEASQLLSSEGPVLQVGKTKGSGSFSLDVVGIQHGEVYQNSVTVPEQEVVVADTFLSKAWTDKFISSLDYEYYYSTPANNIVSQVIEASMKDRVLSRFTAFLALEPKDSLLVTNNPNQNPGNTGGPVSVVDDTKVEIATEQPVVQAYPNPFNAQTSLRLRLPKGITSEQTSLRIYNLLGQLVRTISSDGLSDSRTSTITWDGRNDQGATVPSGMYFFVMSTPKGQHSLKLVILK